MGVRTDASQDRYDVIVIGGGIGGLAAAATLAETGRKVLLVERHDRAGGYGHAFKRRKYTFDSAVHMITGAEPGPLGGAALVDGLLSLLKVRDRCEFRKVDPLYGVAFPGFRLEVPSGPGWLDAHAERFPHERHGLRRLQRLTRLLAREVLTIPAEMSTDDLDARDDLALLREHRTSTVGEVFDRYLDDPHLKAVLSALWPYVGVPPSRAAFSFWAIMLMSHVDLGGYYCVASFQRLVDALASGLTDRGGEILLRSSVRRILVDENRVTGVQLDNGQRVSAPVVVSNVDPLQTFEELVGTEQVADRAYLAHLRGLQPSLSAAVLYLATDLDVAQDGVLAHETFLYDSWDHDDSYRRILRGEATALSVTVPTLVDPELAPAGQHLVVATALVPYDAVTSWRGAKPALESAILEQVGTLIPGLSERVRFREGGTPRTMERYTLNLSGSIYGWDQTPEQSGTDRLPHRTPVEGLFLSGHWTQPGGGVQSVLTSGIHTAELVSGENLMAALFPALRSA